MTTKRRPWTRVDWEIVNAAMAYHEAASYGQEELGDDFPPKGFQSWNEYERRATITREKIHERRT